jgi:hypothetical protein
VPLLTEMTGNAKTVTVETAVLDETHPWALEPVTENELVDPGLTVALPLEKV